jgi:hypothetical protein
MPAKRIRITVLVDGVRRSLFSVLEKPNSDLIIVLGGPPRLSKNLDWEASPRIVENRISVHRSPLSEQYTTIKKTLNTQNGEIVTAVALTDAVKLQTGFSPIFTRRVEDLSGDGYSPLGKIKVGDLLLTLPEFDRGQFTLFVGLFVGHPGVEFSHPGVDLEYAVESMIFKEFQLIAIFSLYPMASHYTSEYAYSV